jgi:hypothetical protein
MGSEPSNPSAFGAAPVPPKAVTAAPAPPPSTSVPPTPDINVQPAFGENTHWQVQHYLADSDAPAVRGIPGGEGSHAVEVKQELDQAENGTSHMPLEGHRGAAECFAQQLPGHGHAQVRAQVLNNRAAPQLNPPPSTSLAAPAQSMPVWEGACTTRAAILGAGQQAAAAQYMAVGRGMRGALREASEAAQAPPAGDMVPTWDPDRSCTLLVPMPSQTARHIESERLELGGVLLPAECSQSLSLHYRPQQQVLAVSGHQSHLALLAGAALLPSQLLGGEGGAGPSCLVIRASWPLAAPGTPVRVMFGAERKIIHPGTMS